MPALLPDILNTYFNACNASHIDEAAACFATDAQVLDESETYKGIASIRAWIVLAKQKYQYTAKIKSYSENDGVFIVTTTVTGNFPGSPIELDYAFTLSGNEGENSVRIQMLVIE